MTARMRRIASDLQQVKKDFAGHKNIMVTPIGGDLPEKYHVTYFINGIYLLPDGKIEVLGRHEVEITLHADYPRYKPICRILTPIWHPNFRDGQICIGDIWGAGESLSDIIINIGDMIQYKSWNSFSPLSADAAQWAIENKHLFPIGSVELNIADYASAKDSVKIDLFDENGDAVEEQAEEIPVEDTPVEDVSTEEILDANANDFEITAEELEGIEFIPTAQRMQTLSHSTVKGGMVNFKTVLIKGLLWAFIGAILGFIGSEFAEVFTNGAVVADVMGYSYLSDYLEYTEKADDVLSDIMDEFENYCKQNGLDSESDTAFTNWLNSGMSERAETMVEQYLDYSDKSETALYNSYDYEFYGNSEALKNKVANITRIETALWSAVIALVIGLALGVGEGVFYGSGANAVKFGAIGAGVALVIGLLSGFLAQWMYSEVLTDDATDLAAALIRGLGWSIMGLGVGVAVGLIKPALKRILFCSIGGLGGGFIGGFLFNYVCDIIPNDVVARGVAIVIMGLLIGLGVGLLEQFAKQAWLKVIRGEFEGKEYLVFSGTTSIGNNGKNTIVLFKDKLVGPHHCDIKLEGNRYVLYDCGTPMGTVVNGTRTSRQILRKGDTIAVGNSVLVFNTK